MSVFGKHRYQNTDADLIPSDWQARKLGDLVSKVGSGVTPKGGSASYLASGVPLIRSQNVLRGQIDISDVAFISDEQHQRMTNSALRPLDVLLNITGASIGRCAVLPEDFGEGNVNQHVCIIRPTGSLDSGFLSHYLNSQLGQTQITRLQAGGNREGLNYQQIRGFLLALPSIPEQLKISAILTAVDDKLDVIARQIDATRTLNRGLMQTLFRRGVGTQDADGRWEPHTRFKDSELGRIPAGWMVGRVGDYISALRSGVSVNAEDRTRDEDEIGVLKVSCVQRGSFIAGNHKAVLVEERDRAAVPVLGGRIIISRANTPDLVGESAYVDADHPELFLSDKLWQTVPSEKSHSVKWLAFYLQCSLVRKEISKAATGTSGSMKNIAKPAFLGIPMPLIPLNEQERIAEILSAIASKVSIMLDRQTHYQTLKRGLMQKLLTGEWRIKLEDAEPVAA